MSDGGGGSGQMDAMLGDDVDTQGHTNLVPAYDDARGVPVEEQDSGVYVCCAK